jgi:hypothetical protein
VNPFRDGRDTSSAVPSADDGLGHAHGDVGDAPGNDATGGDPGVERRIGSRVEVELEARWSRMGTDDPPTLALLFDLSVRGARLAGWIPLRLEPGDRIELWLEDDSGWTAEVRRAIGDGEYAVQFVDVPNSVKQRLIATVGIAKAGQRTRWATG